MQFNSMQDFENFIDGLFGEAEKTSNEAKTFYFSPSRDWQDREPIKVFVRRELKRFHVRQFSWSIFNMVSLGGSFSDGQQKVSVDIVDNVWRSFPANTVVIHENKYYPQKEAIHELRQILVDLGGEFIDHFVNCIFQVDDDGERIGTIDLMNVIANEINKYNHNSPGIFTFKQALMIMNRAYPYVNSL